MALGNSYVSLEEMKEYLGLADQSSTIYDGVLQGAIDAASRAINERCGRQFNKATTLSERRFRPLNVNRVYVDDFYSLDGLEVSVDLSGTGNYGPVWTSQEYELGPYEDGVKNGVPGWPWWRIDTAMLKFFAYPYLPGRKNRVKVNALWGWAEVPSPVIQACRQHVSEIYNIKDAPFGIQGFGDMGYARIKDNSVTARLLRDYVLDSGCASVGVGG